MYEVRVLCANIQFELIYFLPFVMSGVTPIVYHPLSIVLYNCVSTDVAAHMTKVVH